MAKKTQIITLILATILGLGFFSQKAYANINDWAKGKILLQTEEKGEAWYVNPSDGLRYYLGKPNDALNLMKSLGLGISDLDLAKIPYDSITSTSVDSDKDGLTDLEEDSFGTNKTDWDTDNDGYNDLDEVLHNYDPNKGNKAKLAIDENFSKKLAGKIVLQTQKNGEAWYVNPDNNKRYFLGRPQDAFNLMKSFGLGISNNDLEKISDAQVIEKSGVIKIEAPKTETVPIPLAKPIPVADNYQPQELTQNDENIFSEVDFSDPKHIYGKVINSATLKPIPGANVTISHSSMGAEADINGVFNFETWPLSMGEQKELYIVRENYEISETKTITIGTDHYIEFYLKPKPLVSHNTYGADTVLVFPAVKYSVGPSNTIGRVIDKGTKKGVQGLSVVFENTSISGVTDSNGYFDAGWTGSSNTYRVYLLTQDGSVNEEIYQIDTVLGYTTDVTIEI